MDPELALSRARGRASSTSANRSLERGMEILRAFRAGSEVLGNGDLAERTGLPRSTVSRLTQSLVEAGFLLYDATLRAYRLGPPVLSLAHAMRTGSAVLQAAAPLMRELAQSQHINVGLAMADRDEMVYLESIRYSRKVSLRSVVTSHVLSEIDSSSLTITVPYFSPTISERGNSSLTSLGCNVVAMSISVL